MLNATERTSLLLELSGDTFKRFVIHGDYIGCPSSGLNFNTVDSSFFRLSQLNNDSRTVNRFLAGVFLCLCKEFNATYYLSITRHSRLYQLNFLRRIEIPYSSAPTITIRLHQYINSL